MATRQESPSATTSDEKIVMIGDLHGNLVETELLLSKLQQRLGSEGLDNSKVIFLGDYVDRGPNTRGVLDFLVRLKNRREDKKTVFLCGNHDFGMACYLGCIPASTSSLQEMDLDATRNPAYVSGFFPHNVMGGMHYQGRRWGGSAVYDAEATFRSYGIVFEDTLKARKDLLLAVPNSHKQFLQELDWIHDEQLPYSPGRLVCVHAGLSHGGPVEEQVHALSQRDLSSSVIHDKGDIARLAAFHGRDDVVAIPKELEGYGLLVSGHHGEFVSNSDRYIIDESGGWPTRERGIQALILPEREIVSTSAGTPNS